MKQVSILEVRSELGAGTRGASLGIGAIQVAAFRRGTGYFANRHHAALPDENERLFRPCVHQNAKYIDGIAKVYEAVAQSVQSVFAEKSAPFVVVLAGDHSTAGATIAGLRAAFPRKRLGVVWIDAHADLHTPFTTPSGNVHGMPLAASLGLDNLECQRNAPSAEELDYWEKLKQTASPSPKIAPNDLVFIGLRSTEPEEDFLLQKHQIRVFRTEAVRTEGAAEIGLQALQYLQDCELIYVSFDVDSMDCDLVSRGTGTPVPNGLTADEAQELVCTLLADERACCFEITEVNPTLDDKCNLMAETAFEVLEAATEVVETMRLEVE